MITKYVVCTNKSRTEKLSQEDADILKDATSGSWIEIVQEEAPAFEMPLIEVQIWQLEIVLNNRNLLSAVKTAMENLPEPMRSKVLIAWSKSKTVETTSQAVQLIKGVLGMTDNEVIELFRDAEKETL